MIEQPETLRERLLAVIAQGAEATLSDDEFDSLARAVFAHQFECNAPYRAYCESRGAHPERVERWTEIPAVPTDAFKAAPLVCGDANAAEAVFRTSGTTAGAQRRGVHYLPDLSLYDAALKAGFQRHLVPGNERMRVISLVPAAAEQPDSSLSHMVDEVIATFGAEESGCFVGADGLSLEPLLRALREAMKAGGPVLIAGTSFAFVHLLDALEERGEAIHLPAGSRVMDTGGFKGRSREVPRDALYAAIEARLGVPTAWTVNEYGMTEMSSQFYDGIAGEAAPVGQRLYRGPAWVRTAAYDPETLRPLAGGETGVLRHWDLANLGSVMALQTADLGRVMGEGFELFGRARGAEARGCSIAMDELLEVIGRD
ncbi:MAG TPA: hypothetical protein VFI96_07430 [Longimicrobiaceae bacterium]|nr:hypothetical protein [Longimicrobiaceae bacterium]